MMKSRTFRKAAILGGLAAMVLGATPARAIDERDTIGEAPVGVGPGGDPVGVLPLPAALNCAETYTQSEVAMTSYPTTKAFRHNTIHNEDVDDFPLPFPFIFFGVRYDTVGVCDNGYVSFTDLEAVSAIPNPSHAPIPSAALPNATIAAYWTDLDPTARWIWLDTFGNSPNRAFVITYDLTPRFGAANDNYTFQIVLYETTNIIRFQYLTQNGNNFNMAIGIEDESGLNGYQFSRLTPQSLAGRAIEYVPNMVTLPTHTPPPSPRALSCGANLTAQAMSTGASMANLYGCSLLQYNGREVVYTFTSDSVQLIDLRVTPGSAVNPALFLTSANDRCNCIATGTRIRRVVGPGTYYVVVDTRNLGDSGTFSLSLGCETLLSQPNGTQMDVGASPSTCGLGLDFDYWANSRAEWVSDGWIRLGNERSYFAVKVDNDNNLRYTTSSYQSSCQQFQVMIPWVDDVTDKAVVYWEFPEGIVIQTVNGRSGACCGVLVTQRVVNTTTAGHRYDLRDLRSFDFGNGVSTCAGSRMEGGYLDLGTGLITQEANISCDASGLCGVDCDIPATVKSLEDLLPLLVVQSLGNSAANAIHGEWIRFYDVNRICDPTAPEPWTGGYLPTPDRTDGCTIEDSLLYTWTVQPGGTALAAGASYSVSQAFGDGCVLATCPCFAHADIQVPSYSACTNSPLVLDGIGSQVADCTRSGGTITYQWTRNGTNTVTTSSYTANEAVAGTYTYGVTVGCTAAGFTCTDSRTVNVNVVDCAQCNINSLVSAPWTPACLNVPVAIDSSTSVINGCPSTPTYSWTKNGLPIPGTGPTVQADVSAIGSANYAVTIRCPLPPGFNCVSTSANLSVSVVDCSSCAATSALTGDSSSLCIGSSALLDATGSIVTGCPGATSYSWRRDNVPLPDTTPTINALETMVGLHSYDVTVGCLPAGGNCSSTSQPWPLQASDCSTCDVTVDLVGDASSACTGVPVTLNSGVVVTNCPGTTTYRWERDAVALPDTTPTLVVNEGTPGQYTYTFRGSCDPPPTGLNCFEDGTPFVLDVVDCSACAITADLVGDAPSVCLGTPINLSATGSVVNGCPGATVYEWERNAIVLPATTPTIPVTETVAGTYLYGVSVTCGPPPAGANCSDTAPRWSLSAVDCANCAITADLSDSPPIACESTNTVLTTSASDTASCPGTVSYAWEREGIPVAGSGSTLVINEVSPGAVTYSVTMTCNPPPTGLVCAPSRADWLVTTQTCACSITAGMTGIQATCVNDTVVLDALAGSTVIACPGTLSFAWTEDGVPVAGATQSTLSVSYPVPVAHDYAVTVTCNGPPGLNCLDTSAAYTVTWSDGIQPGDLGNTLLGYRQLIDVHLVWQQDVAGGSLTYDLLRGTAKSDLPLPGPPVVRTGLPTLTVVDPAAVDAPNNYFYRVRGVSCPGLVGPY